MKKAVILFNLGGPDKLENVQPFLFNLFNDPAILNLPTFLRYPLAKLISNRRAPTAKKIYEEASTIHLRHIEIMTNDYITPYSSQNGNPPLLNYFDVYVTPYDPSGRWMIRSNEDWIEHIQDVLKKSERRLFNRYGKYYFFTLKNCNSFVDKLNFTIEKSKKREKDIIHNVNVVSKKHNLPVEICKYIIEYVYTCPYDQNYNILYYEN